MISFSINEVAEAGFVYYPNTPNYEDKRKIMTGTIRNKPAKSSDALTICPRCLKKVDWKLEKRKSPKDIEHCVDVKLVMNEIVHYKTQASC